MGKGITHTILMALAILLILVSCEELQASHGHTYSEKWTHDDTFHWHASTCGHDSEVIEKGTHEWGDWIVDKVATENETGSRHRVCTVCGAKETILVEVHVHTYSEKWTYDENYHWHNATCEHTDEKSEKAVHTWGAWITDKNATETETGLKHRVCSVCGCEEKGTIPLEIHVHTYAEKWSHDDTFHWHASACGHEEEVSDKEAHKWKEGGDEDGWIIDVDSTEKEVGKKHRECSVCGYKEEGTVPLKGHVHTFSAYSHTVDKHWKTCTGCGEKFSSSHSLTYDSDTHYKTCYCGYSTSEVAHTMTKNGGN